MKDKAAKQSIPIRVILISMFVLSMLISISIIGYLVFSNWTSAVRRTTEKLSENMSWEIYHQIDIFMTVPVQINKDNHKLIEESLIDLTDEQSRNKFFAVILNSYDKDIYGFGYGTAEGEYYGARRNKSGETEIINNNADTGGRNLYYSVNSDLTAGEMTVDAGKYDPRTRSWYQAAAEAGGPVFSSVYKHFLIDDLTISAAWPIYNGEDQLRGVLGTHILMSTIESYLAEIVHDNMGYAFIVEKGTGEFVANTMGLDNFKVLQDGTLYRNTFADFNNPSIAQAYARYELNHELHFWFHGEDDNLHINLEEYQNAGLDWIIVSAIPDSLLMAEVSRNIRTTVLLVFIAVLLSVVIYFLVSSKLLDPMKNLSNVAESLSSGDLSQRAKIVRNDEIGRISYAFNDMADKLQYLINNLESTVNNRTEELHRTNEILEENKNQLRLLLDSTAEAIYGIDQQGNCTFCNESCIRLLGYDSTSDLLGRNMHQQIHHSRKDKSPLPVEECKISQAFVQGRGTYADDEVFWKADGTPINVEYYSYPQYKNGQVVGSVVTFMDTTSRNENEEKIKYMSCHDALTGLYNRRCFEDAVKQIDIPELLPISIIFADINGLKMTNDVFGHDAGDALIKKTAEILKETCRDNDIVSRVGGDEFVILLPSTTDRDARLVISRIHMAFSKARILAVKCSIAMGCNTKTAPEQSVEEVMANAEDEMYKYKSANRKNTSSEMIGTIIEALHVKSPKLKEKSIAVSALCRNIGTMLNLSETENKKLEQAGFLVDIGKIVLDEAILNKENLTEEEKEIRRQHAAISYRILNLFDDTLDLADGVYSHHEHWDGTGYPKRLKGKEIPLMARVIAAAEAYYMLTKKYAGMDDILAELKKQTGTILDPEVVSALLRAISNNPDQH
ncbi:MAG: diguanylate cyclase [Oscillospiraceae bacterium]